jgi:hypothetical protein
VTFSTSDAKEKAKRFYNGKLLGWKYLSVMDKTSKGIVAKKDMNQVENDDK